MPVSSNNNRLLSVLLLVVLSSLPFAASIFSDEIGISDFLVATSGHGPAQFVSTTASGSVITSDSPVSGHQLLGADASAKSSSTSCFVASRSWDSGELLWRRNVCTAVPGSSSSSSSTILLKHAVTAAEEGLWSMDASGVVRAWTTAGGQLLWEALVPATNQPRVLVAPTTGQQQPSAMGAVSDEVLTWLDATTGEAMAGSISPLRADQVMKQQGGSGGSRGAQASWLQVLSDQENTWTVLLGWVRTESDGTATTNGADMLVVTMEWKDETLQMTGSQRLNHIKDSINVSTLQVSAGGQGVAVTADGTRAVSFGVSNGESNFESSEDISSLLSSWSKLTSVTALSETVARVAGLDSTTGQQQQFLFQLPSWTPIQNDQSQILTASGLVSCGNDAVASVLGSGKETHVQMWTLNGSGGAKLSKVNMDVGNAIFDYPVTMAAQCVDGAMKLLLTTAAGTTAALEVTTVGESSRVVWKWDAEEGLGQIASALLLDASHAVVVDDLVGVSDASLQEEPIEIARRLQFSARLSSQWSSLMSSGMSFISSSASAAAKERLFGFLQVAVLVSEQTNRLYGVPLAGPKRGSVAWAVDLSLPALWHKLVHGTFNARKSTHGIHGGTHAREVLVVSGHSDRVEWKCIDGTNGDIHAEGAVAISSPVMQVLPMVGSGPCRQQAVLMLEDHSTAVIPESDSTSLDHALEESTNGIFVHVASGSGSTAARLESYQITSQTSPARLVGQAAFPGETLITTVYPTRDEAIDSPCTVLGDDSLLLKYLNPHVAVLVTVRDEAVADEDDEDPIDAVLRRSMQQTDKKKKKKPLGVTPKPTGSKSDPTTADTDTAAAIKEDEPNLFINVVDTVSGRILYRASHANAATSPRHIRAVISENWVVYSFVNAKTKKSEIGVLSLYEGMIHKKGLTAFNSPEQATEFSSLDARETKPVVLAKTYSIAKPVTALGMTHTRNGISSRQVLLATNDDHIYALPRNVLEPRRPLSDLKDSEKLEGLRQYAELVPLVTLQVLSYNLTVHGATQILSAPTELESQTLVFAYGGPDLFFSRTSPSKSFDMLPESFNRILLSMLVIGLVTVVVVTKRMATAKMVSTGWL